MTMTTSNLSAGLAIFAGILTVLSPCVLPILPSLVARSLTSHPFGPLALIAGLIVSFAAVGSLLGVTASWLNFAAIFLKNAAVVMLLLAGLSAIFPLWNYRLSSYLPLGKWLKEPQRLGLLGEFCLGTQLGLLWTPCAGSVLGSILIVAAVKHDIVSAFFLLTLYGIGASIPLVCLAYGGRYLSKYFWGLRSKSAILQKIGGVIVVATAILILFGWDVEIQLWLAPFFPSIPI